MWGGVQGYIHARSVGREPVRRDSPARVNAQQRAASRPGFTGGRRGGGARGAPWTGSPTSRSHPVTHQLAASKNRDVTHKNRHCCLTAQKRQREFLGAHLSEGKQMGAAAPGAARGLSPLLKVLQDPAGAKLQYYVPALSLQITVFVLGLCGLRQQVGVV